ncbi:hypothetical protein [Laribacter hongkongensis]|nr:hypothetical protein [Laribacter hongkongensis]
MTLTGTRTTSSGGYTGAGTTDLNAGALLTGLAECRFRLQWPLYRRRHG